MHLMEPSTLFSHFAHAIGTWPARFRVARLSVE